ncbi:MAG TPA: hypothetical protein ENN47_05365 [Mesotoga infera]|uniref:Uncharacterized protein n=1 Tax=Mesotoga infera TaxID=1236046 RepID=A0A7C1GT56_9BACT|nr:hypothetical protein [Mesotoga infera]
MAQKSKTDLRSIFLEIKEMVRLKVYRITLTDGKRELNISRPPMTRSEKSNLGFIEDATLAFSNGKSSWSDEHQIEYCGARKTKYFEYYGLSSPIRKRLTTNYYSHCYNEIEKAMQTAYYLQPNFSFNFKPVKKILHRDKFNLKDTFDNAKSFIKHITKKFNAEGYEFKSILVPSTAKGNSYNGILHYHLVGAFFENGRKIINQEELLHVFRRVFKLTAKGDYYYIYPNFESKYYDAKRKRADAFCAIALSVDYSNFRNKCELYNIENNLTASLGSKVFKTSFTPSVYGNNKKKTYYSLFSANGCGKYKSNINYLSSDDMDMLYYVINEYYDKQIARSEYDIGYCVTNINLSRLLSMPVVNNIVYNQPIMSVIAA